MSGFTIYETLRIFVPGALATLILDVVLRLATGEKATDVASGAPASIVGAIENATTFLLLALVFGLLLYLLDLPERLRIAKGNKPRDVPRPSDEMRRMLQTYNDDVEKEHRYAKAHFLSLFFLFTDSDLPDDLRKRIYLFGALFKIFVDIRVLLVTAIALGVPSSISYAAEQRTTTPNLSIDGVATISVLTMAVTIGILGFLAQVAFTREENHFYQGRSDKRIETTGANEVTWPAAILTALMSLSICMASVLEDGWRYLSIAPAAMALLVWFSVEIGPPDEDDAAEDDAAEDGQLNVFQRKSLEFLSQEKFLKYMGVRPRKGPQLPIWFRTTTDLALLIPALVGSSIAAVYLGRSPSATLAWAVLVFPAVLIMTVHKHEKRQIGAFHHQLAYLELSRNRIREALRSRRGLGS